MSSGSQSSEELNEDVLKGLFERSQKENPEKMSFTPEEADKFKSAFEDPEFRKLFANYMDELQDPKNRDENEAYISQLEGEQKVPEGKELVRPDPGFVAKTHKVSDKSGGGGGGAGGGGAAGKDKVFLNIVQSVKIAPPSKTPTAKGDCWSVPYSLGPPHMEKDKSGNNAPCFDCCFHPEALRLGKLSKEFKNLLVTTAMDGVEQGYRQQGHNVTLNRDFHIVKGIDYKSGKVPTMMIATASKEKWESQQQSSTTSSSSGTKSAAGAEATAAAAASSPAAASAEKSTSAAAGSKPGPAIKKGFLNSAKSSIYGDKLTTIRPAQKRGTAPEGDTRIRTQPAAAAGGAGAGASAMADITVPPSGSEAAKQRHASSAASLIEDVTGKASATVAAKTTLRAPATAPGTAPAAATATAPSSAPGLKAVATTSRRRSDVAATASTSTTSTDATAAPPAGAAGAGAESSVESAPQQGLEVPAYTVKERGHLGMGDFERSDAVVSNRPSELVYSIRLPKISKASLIELDVSERVMSLKYPDVYELRLKLPYPVHDKRTAAKYEKASKSLTVTLPVKPAPVERVTRPAAADAPLDAPGGVQALPSPPKPPARDDAAAAAATGGGAAAAAAASAGATSKQKPKHDRWVAEKDSSGLAAAAAAAADSADAASSPAAASSSAALYEEIQRKAAEAVEAAKQKQQQREQHHQQQLTPAAEKNTSAASAVPAPSSCDEEFIASSSFRGRKEGYAFRTGNMGLGYYRDNGGVATRTTKSSPHTAPSEAGGGGGGSDAVTASTASSSPPATAGGGATAGAGEAFPFECRQMKQTIAMLVQVADIDVATCEVRFGEYSIDIRFTSGGGSKQYAMGLQLAPEQCAGGLAVAECRYDIAAHNMALVLAKQLPGYWGCTSSEQQQQQSAEEESKSRSEEEAEAAAADKFTRKLFTARPFAPVSVAAAAAVAVAARSGSAAPASRESLTPAAPVMKSLQQSMQALQFSSNEALFDLD